MVWAGARSPLFPYTTLFRSAAFVGVGVAARDRVDAAGEADRAGAGAGVAPVDGDGEVGRVVAGVGRAEVHTRDLQGGGNLVGGVVRERRSSQGPAADGGCQA